MQGFNYQVPAVSFGSGSPKTASLNVEVVTDEEQVQAEQVHPFGFGERQGFPDEPGQALSWTKRHLPGLSAAGWCC